MPHQKRPFIYHLHELRRRLFYCAAALISGGVLGYVLQSDLLRLIVKPLGQQLYYSNPTGGFSFFFNICLLFGAILTLPVIVYNLVKFITPALNPQTQVSIAVTVVASIMLAAVGITFAYLFSLPAALHFLSSFGQGKVAPLIFAGEYLRFVIIYLLSFAALFQLPVIIGFMNHIKPLKPSGMMGFQRYVIAGSFIIAALITPTPDPINQFIMAAPMIVLYQLSIVYVWYVNRSRRWVEPISDLNLPSWIEPSDDADILPEIIKRPQLQTVPTAEPAATEVMSVQTTEPAGSGAQRRMTRRNIDGFVPAQATSTQLVAAKTTQTTDQAVQPKPRIIDDIVSAHRPLLVQ